MWTGIRQEADSARFGHNAPYVLSLIEDIRSLETPIATIRTAINKQNVVDEIPNEILHHIFFNLVSKLHAEYWDFLSHGVLIGSGRNAPYDQCVGSLSLVCKRWRDVVNCSPLLWSFITANDETNPFCVLRSIRMSGRVGLHVRAERAWGGENDAVVTEMLKQLPRAHTLELNWGGDEIINFPPLDLAPLLSTIHLECRDDLDKDHPLLTFFNRISTPRLKYFATDCPTAAICQTFVRPSLACLRLEDPYYDGISMTPDSILDMLAYLPLLERFQGYFPFDIPDATSNRIPRIPLRRIKEFEIFARPAFCVGVLGGLLLPSPVALSIGVIFPYRNNRDKIESTVKCVASTIWDLHLDATSHPPFQLRLRYQDAPHKNNLRLSLRRKENTSNIQQQPTPSLTVTLVLRYHTNLLASHFLEQLSMPLPLEQVQEVILVGADRLLHHRGEGVPPFLIKMPKVERLICVGSKLSTGGVTQLLEHLMSPAVVPNLQHLIFKNVIHHSRSRGYPIEPILNQTCDILQTRKAMNPNIAFSLVETKHIEDNGMNDGDGEEGDGDEEDNKRQDEGGNAGIAWFPQRLDQLNVSTSVEIDGDSLGDPDLDFGEDVDEDSLEKLLR